MLQVLYDTTYGTVLQWQDTSKYNYAEPAQGTAVLEVTQEQFDNQSGTWYVVNDELTQTTPLPIAQAQQINVLKTTCNNAINNGFTTTINGTSYTFTLSQTDQINLSNAAVTTSAIIQQAKQWTASTAVTAYSSIIEVNGNYYICTTSGTTGTTEPTTWPTQYQQTIIDGTAHWALYGMLLGTTTGNVWFSATQIVQIYSSVVSFINQQRAKYTALKAEVNSATTVSAVQAITW